MKKEILGVKVDDVTMEEALKRCHPDGRRGDTLKTSFLIFTVNPEFLVTAQRDEEFRKILNAGDLNVPDGVGLQIFGGIKNRIPGVDLMLRLCEVASSEGWTVGLLGGREGVAKETAKKLVQRFKSLKVEWAIDGEEADKIVTDYGLRTTGVDGSLLAVDLLFVALGCPKQEKFLWKIQNNFGFRASDFEFGVGMGVGGSFDYISGKIRRAPGWMQSLGLEWLFRLYQEPRRIGRMIAAILIYPFDILLDGLMGKK